MSLSFGYRFMREDDIEYQELAAQGRAERARARRFCCECYCVGGHASGCPEDDTHEPDETDETDETDERSQP